jgi:UDP-hydrolysing UDP-N-acetyl-D-glucosamine 2-epimerase
MNRRKVAVVLVDRANYGRMKPVMQEIANEETIEMQVICAGTMMLERFGSPIKVVKQDGFQVSSEIYIELEGSTPTTMAKSVGFATIEFSSEFQRLKPDIVLIIGDRYEALAAAIAASYMNLCIAHIQGGEVSGSIDESARHCITKLAHYHFPATKRSAEYICRMGEHPETVFQVGCPSGDIALSLDRTLPDNIFSDRGIGAELTPAHPYILVVFHPVTTYYGEQQNETRQLLLALSYLKLPTVWLWPNIDAGSDYVSKTIRSYREQHDTDWLRLIKNFSPENYLKVLANAICAVGNSSSFVRDASFLGTPVVLVGDRQQGREIAENVIKVPAQEQEILYATKQQLERGRYAPSHLYGNGMASRQIVEILTQISPYVQKRLAYPASIES